MAPSVSSRAAAEPRHAARLSFDERLDAVRADLRSRLHAACAHLPAPDFAALLDTMARRALRWSAFPDGEAHLPPM